MSRVNRTALTPEERVSMAYAQTAQEARALVLVLAPDSPQAKRIAHALAQLVDWLWPPEVNDRRKR
jgi:hypothetical protein